MKEISLYEKKQLMLEILDEVDKFCRKNEIKYFLTYGSLLGAVRHKGYIPWDDDLDIALLRKDYDRLINEFNSVSGNMNILDYRRRNNYIWPYAKIVHNRTILVESNNYKASIGVFIDVFPLDNIIGSLDEVKNYVNKISKWQKILTVKHLEVLKKRAFLKNLIIIICRVFKIIPDKLLIRKIETMSKKYISHTNSKYVCSLCGAYGIKEIALRKNFEIAVNHIFEGRYYYIPIGYDNYLNNLYGDYMTLPSIEKRVSTHSSKEYWP